MSDTGWGAYRKGPRRALVSELLGSAEGWSHVGKNELAAQARSAVEALQHGAEEVTVGHTTFRVVDPVDPPMVGGDQ